MYHPAEQTQEMAAPPEQVAAQGGGRGHGQRRPLLYAGLRVSRETGHGAGLAVHAARALDCLSAELGVKFTQREVGRVGRGSSRALLLATATVVELHPSRAAATSLYIGGLEKQTVQGIVPT